MKQTSEPQTVDGSATQIHRKPQDHPLEWARADQPGTIAPLAALQAKLNIGPTVQRLAALQQRANAAAPLQRMVLPVWNKKTDKKDFLSQGGKQSELLEHGTVINVDNWVFNKNLQGIGLAEDLHIIGHGSPATIAGMAPDVLAAHLLRLGLPAGYTGRIYLEACQSGTETVELEGSYAQRFIAALNEARGEDATPLDAVGYDGTVALDDTIKDRPTLRVIPPDRDMRQIGLQAIEETKVTHDAFVADLTRLGFSDFVDGATLTTLYCDIYEAKVSKRAPKAGGAATIVYSGEDATTGPAALPSTIMETMLEIKEAARARAAEDGFGGIEDLSALLGDLGPITVTGTGE